MSKLNIFRALFSVLLLAVMTNPVKAVLPMSYPYMENNSMQHAAPSFVDGVESELGYVAVGVSMEGRFGQTVKWQDHFCATSEICALGDVDGDKKADIIKFVRTNNGTDDSDVYVALSSGTDFGTPQKWQDYFCTLDEICEVGDVNGDGKADIIAFEWANNFNDQGVVRVALSSGTAFVADEPYKNVWTGAFCVLNDFCAVGDVTGDGKADIVNFSRFNWPETTDNNLGGIVPGVTNNVYIAAFKDKFYRFSFKDVDYTVFQSSSTDGRIWSDYQVMPNVKSIWVTAASPSSFCVLGRNTNDQPFTSCTSDPALGWPSPSINNFPPAWLSIDISYFQGRFYAIGLTQSNQIAISSSADGVQWTPSQLINSIDTTRNPPLIAGSKDNQLYR